MRTKIIFSFLCTTAILCGLAPSEAIAGGDERPPPSPWQDSVAGALGVSDECSTTGELSLLYNLEIEVKDNSQAVGNSGTFSLQSARTGSREEPVANEIDNKKEASLFFIELALGTSEIPLPALQRESGRSFSASTLASAAETADYTEAPASERLDVTHFTAGFRQFFHGTDSLVFFYGLGVGVYELDPGSQEFGMNARVGAELRFNRDFGVEVGGNYHRVVTPGAELNFFTLQAGLRYHFGGEP